MPLVGVLGGTFDPVHVGHLAAAQNAAYSLALDRVVLVPTNAQPLKPLPSASAHDRLAMCRLAVNGNTQLEVSDVDIARGGTTYTIDTLTDLKRLFPDDDLVFLTGADALATLPQWRSPEQIAGLATIVGFTRAGHPQKPSDAPVSLVEVPDLAVSSTDVRRRVRAGAPIRYLVPEPVRHFIEDHGLYRGGMDD